MTKLLAGTGVQLAMKQAAGQKSHLPRTKLPSSQVSPGSTFLFPQQPCPAGQSVAASKHAALLPVHRPIDWHSDVQSEGQKVPAAQFAVPLSQVSPKSPTPSPQHAK